MDNETENNYNAKNLLGRGHFLQHALGGLRGLDRGFDLVCLWWRNDRAAALSKSGTQVRLAAKGGSCNTLLRACLTRSAARNILVHIGTQYPPYLS